MLIHIYSDRGALLVKIARSDGLVGWNDQHVTVRRREFLLTYNPDGTVCRIEHTPHGH